MQQAQTQPAAAPTVSQESMIRPKIFESDALQSQRELYLESCEALDFDPEQPDPIDPRYQVSVSCRCLVSERTRAAALARKFGVTKNTMVLSALKLGMKAFEDALEDIDGES